MMKKLALLMINIYQVAISPLMGPACRFIPTCSEYAHQAIAEYGVGRGGLLALKRILRCHPFHPGGIDPVP
jgi:putative membrane protein insertion efficiency factor